MRLRWRARRLCYCCAVIFSRFCQWEIGGRVETNTLSSGVFSLFQKGMWPLAILVFLTTIAIPILKVVLTLYVLVPLHFGFQLPHAARMFRINQTLTPWGMLEVYLLGVLVALTKLATMSTIIAGPALFCFVVLIVVLAWTQASLEPRDVWDQLS